MAKELLERPAVVGRGGGIHRQRFAVPDAGEAILNLRIAAAGTDWGKAEQEAGTLRVEFEGIYSQHLIVFGGADEVLYQRFLGDIGIGAHEIMFTFSPEGSAPRAQWIRALSMQVDVIPYKDPRYVAVTNAPLIYGRAEADSYENRRSDSPLYAFYRFPKGGITGREIEYFVMYSHLDKGADPAQRLATTGILAPIEWTFRGALDSAGRATRNLAFQGGNHKPHGFAGTYDMGSHPILQLVGYEGMLHDKQTTPYRFGLPPLQEIPEDRPLAWVQNMQPLSYRIAALELLREAKIENPANHKTKALADPRNYLFLQFGVQAGANRRPPTIEVVVTLQGQDTQYTSTFGDPRWGIEVTGPFATAVKLPTSTGNDQIREVRIRTLPGRRDPFELQIVPQAAFFLQGPTFAVGPMLPGIPAPAPVTLSRDQPEAVTYRAQG